MVLMQVQPSSFYIIPRIGISKDTKLYIMDPSPVSPKVGEAV